MFTELCDKKIKQMVPPKMNIFQLIYFYLWIILGSIIVMIKWTKIEYYGSPKTCFKNGKLGLKKKFSYIGGIK
jgi:hypothetical protein